MSEWGFCDITVGLCEVIVEHSEVTSGVSDVTVGRGSVRSQWRGAGLRGITTEGGRPQ